MKTNQLLFAFALSCGALTTANAKPADGLKVPLRRGVYLADVTTRIVRSLGDFGEWSVSPDGRFCVGGRESGSRSPFYEVSLVSISGGKARRLERFRISEPTGAAFHWSSDSLRIRVVTDRNGDGKDESKSFSVARSSPTKVRQTRQRALSASALRRLKARFSSVRDVVFSPDGSRVVAYLSRSEYFKPDFDGGLWMFSPDGTSLRRLTRNVPLSRRDLRTGVPLASHDLEDREPRWLPDGNRLAFRRTSYEDEGI